MADLFNTYLNIGDTNKFFMPWFIPRQNRHSVFQSTFLSRLFGRRRRDIADEDIEFEINGKYCSFVAYLLILLNSLFNFSDYILFTTNPRFIFLDYDEISNKINTCEEYDRECFDKYIYDKMNTVYNGSVLHEIKLMICFI